MVSESQTNAAGGYDKKGDGGRLNNINRGTSSSQGQHQVHQSTVHDHNYMYGDSLDVNREANDGSILCLSLNVNGLKQEKWKAKND